MSNSQMLLGPNPEPRGKRGKPVWLFGDGRTSHLKAHHAGTHRICSPAQTFARFAPLMPKLGVTRLANVTGLDTIGLPVYVSVRPNARSLSVSQGKGYDAASAKVSALMEAFELWHAEHISAPIRRGTYEEVARDGLTLSLDTIPRMRGCALPTDRVWEWIEGFDLLAERTCWVPLEAVDMNWARQDGVTPVFRSSSNGLASGNHAVEATVHALCELIERDATATWFADDSDPSGKATQLDLTTVDDAECVAMLRLLARASVHVAAYDVTGGLGIPTYAAVIFDTPGSIRVLGYYWGFGCHLTPAVALARALSEAVQCRLTSISGSREDIAEDDYESDRNDDELVEMEKLISEPAPVLRFDVQRSLASASMEDDLATVLAALRAGDHPRVVVVDLSSPEYGVPVVKALVPSLRNAHGEEDPLQGPDTGDRS